MAKNILIYGLHAMQAYLERHPEGVLEVYLLKTRDDDRLQKLVSALRPLGLTLQWRERAQLDELAGDTHHQGVVARVREQAPGDEHALMDFLDSLEVPPFLLLLDSVTDPHNLGACLRSADAAGVQAVITPRDKSASITPVVPVRRSRWRCLSHSPRPLCGRSQSGSEQVRVASTASPSLVESDERVSPRSVLVAPPGASSLSHVETQIRLIATPPQRSP